MYKEIRRLSHTGSRIMLFVFLMCCSVCPRGRVHGAPSYRLSREGYSPALKALLIAVVDDPCNVHKSSWLAIYDEASGSTKRVAIPGNAFCDDFAWAPGRLAFVVTHIEGLTFFQQDASAHGYTPKAIRYPTDAWYTYCSWSSKGEWLAVNSPDRERMLRGRLGLYRFDAKKLVRTGLAIDYRQVLWGNDGLLYATNDNSVLTIEVKGGEARVIRTLPLKGELTLFYGMFGEQPLFQAFDEIRLGDKTLATLDQAHKFRVLATETVVFVSASRRQLTAFDRSGTEIGRSDPGRLIKFGSVKDANTVYALADSDLVCVRVEKGSLSIDTVSDLHDATAKE